MTEKRRLIMWDFSVVRCRADILGTMRSGVQLNPLLAKWLPLPGLDKSLYTCRLSSTRGSVFMTHIGLPVPNGPYGLCGRKATMRKNTSVRVPASKEKHLVYQI